MNKRVRNLIAGIFGTMIFRSGYINAIEQNIPKGSILPLCFHNPEKRLFKLVVQWLFDHGYSFVTNEQLLKCIQSGLKTETKAAWISFDDGWRENVDRVIPTLIEHNIPATFFLTTGPIGSEDGTFWWPLMRTNRAKLAIPYDELWTIPESRRRVIVESVMMADHIKIPRQAMTIADIKLIADLSQITLGCHTVNHGISANHTQAELIAEICDARESIHAWTGLEVHSFAYPRGVFDPRARYILRENGFTMAATTEATILNPQLLNSLDPFCIPRIPIPDSGSFYEILCHMLSIWQPCMRRLKSILGLKPSEFTLGE